ncbi:TRAP transporter small permease [Pseudoalteromonas sp. 20-92]|nr:TRAP transporter small permease [Pseudoalteromonas fuliginea]MDQ2044757.1 TRAP transporter small permease [Pseudoalteromonas sp. 20-92]
MRKFNTLLNHLIERILIMAMVAIVAVVCWQVFSRFIMRSPSSYTEELARFLLIWIGVLGAAYAYRTRAHLGLDLFYEKMKPRLKHKCAIFIELIALITASSLLIYGGALLMLLSFDLKQTSAALGINMGFVYLVLPLSGVLIAINCLDNLLQLAATRQKEEV